MAESSPVANCQWGPNAGALVFFEGGSTSADPAAVRVRFPKLRLE